MIYDVSQYVQKVTGSKVQKHKPIVGESAFLHEAGIHQAGVINNKQTYEILSASDYGISVNGIVLGNHSGKSAFISEMKRLGFNVDEYDIFSILKEIKDDSGNKISITD